MQWQAKLISMEKTHCLPFLAQLWECASPVPWWCDAAVPLASPVAAMTSVLCVSCSRGMQRFPKHKICHLPWAQNPPNCDTLVEQSLSESGISRNKSSTALIHFSKCNNAPFPPQLLMGNKGIKRDRNAQSWGTCISCTAVMPAANSESCCDVQAGSQAWKWNRVREQENYFPKPPKL